jgi:signal transduction histidine kinase
VGADPGRPGTGLGLIGMRERLEAVGGSLLVSRPPHGGFMLRAELPLLAAVQ